MEAQTRPPEMEARYQISNDHGSYSSSLMEIHSLEVELRPSRRASSLQILRRGGESGAQRDDDDPPRCRSSAVLTVPDRRGCQISEDARFRRGEELRLGLGKFRSEIEESERENLNQRQFWGFRFEQNRLPSLSEVAGRQQIWSRTVPEMEVVLEPRGGSLREKRTLEMEWMKIWMDFWTDSYLMYYMVANSYKLKFR